MILGFRVIRLKAMRAAYLRGGIAQIIRCLSPLLAFYLCVSAFICGCFSSVSDASSPPANNVHICEVFDYGDMQARDSLYAAAKQALNLNVGEPRTVRMIYFLPNDRPFQQAVVDSMKVTIRQVQTFYAEQMEAHGYGRKTFRFETNAQGDPVVHRVDGRNPDSHYLDDTVDTVFNEIGQAFDTSANNVYLLVWDNSTGAINGVAGVGAGGRDRGCAIVPGRFHWKTVAHELGHAFGLNHDWRDGDYIMSYGTYGDYNALSACAAEFLSVHPYLNPDIPDEETLPPTIELISSPEYPTGSTSVSIQLQVSDPDGLHQVILFVSTESENSLTVKACRGLNGEINAVVQFDYDGVIPSSNDPQGTGTSFLNPLVHNIYVEVVDAGGNVNRTGFSLFDDSAQRNLIATLEGHTNEVRSVLFSPDGSLLASVARDTIKLWDVTTREIIAMLTDKFSTYSLAFSPDGSLLASVARDTIKLWDVTTREIIATLEGHTNEVRSVLFSPDGSLLASAEEDGAVKLWDVATREPIATFGDDSYEVTFSPDGSLLASAEEDGAVKLWNVVTREHIATFGGDNYKNKVPFSPDGSLLATIGGRGRAIKLWDVATREPIATFGADIYELLFSPDGSLLASVSGSAAVILWDVGTRRAISALGGRTYRVNTVAFSPDGTVLASGADDGQVLLWDMSSYITPSTPTPALTPDFDGDGTVGFADFLQFVEQFGFSRSDEGYEARFDLDGDGVIGFGDFLIFVDNFGKKMS